MELDRWSRKNKTHHCRGPIFRNHWLFLYQLPHTVAFLQTLGSTSFWVLWTDQSNIRPKAKKKKKHASKLKGEPSKLDEQTLPKAIPQFPCKFPEQLLCIQVLAKEYSQPNCFLATSCVVRSIAAFFFFCPCKAFATWLIYFSFFLLHRLLNNATMPQKRL